MAEYSYDLNIKIINKSEEVHCMRLEDLLKILYVRFDSQS